LQNLSYVQDKTRLQAHTSFKECFTVWISEDTLYLHV